jgi:hypothetical protein
MLQIVASLIDAARGIIYDHHMFIVQATVVSYKTFFFVFDKVTE